MNTLTPATCYSTPPQRVFISNRFSHIRSRLRQAHLRSAFRPIPVTTRHSSTPARLIFGASYGLCMRTLNHHRNPSRSKSRVLTKMVRQVQPQPLRISKTTPSSTPNGKMAHSRPLSEIGSTERRRNSPSYNQATRVRAPHSTPSNSDVLIRWRRR